MKPKKEVTSLVLFKFDESSKQCTLLQFQVDRGHQRKTKVGFAEMKIVKCQISPKSAKTTFVFPGNRGALFWVQGLKRGALGG